MKTSKVITKVFKYLLFLILAVLVFILIILATSYKDLKAAASGAMTGKNLLEESISAASIKNWQVAQKKAYLAQENIDDSLNRVKQVKERKLFSHVFLLNNQISDLEYLLETVSIVNKSFSKALPIAEEFETIYSSSSDHSFSNLSTEKKEDFFQLIYESEPELNGIRANLELAKINLDQISKVGILYPIYSDIEDLKEKLNLGITLLNQATPLAKIIPGLAGYPSPSNFLIIMHNNDELRPSGGFIGVFGLLKSDNGDIVHLKTYDSYHLDMPAVGNWEMEPPSQIKKYMQVQNWYLRDANWSPDWPTSASKIQEIYKGESKAIGEEPPEFTGVIGITPEFISDLIALVGDIEVRGETYTPENLQPLLQYNVEVAYKEENIASWDRKEIINELLEKLEQRLLNLKTEKMITLLQILENNFSTKDVQIYFNNPFWQSLVEDLGADGEVEKEERSDYLLVVDANLAAFKSDAVVEKSIEYELLPKENNISAELSLGYKHEGGFDWRTTRYRSYTRVYVPLGSKLNEIRAHDSINLDEESINSYDDLSLNKTVFGFFFTLEPGTSGGISLDYNLPQNVLNDWINNDYSLLVQKQAGRRTNLFQAVINGETYNKSLNTDFIINPKTR